MFAGRCNAVLLAEDDRTDASRSEGQCSRAGATLPPKASIDAFARRSDGHCSRAVATGSCTRPARPASRSWPWFAPRPTRARAASLTASHWRCRGRRVGEISHTLAAYPRQVVRDLFALLWRAAHRHNGLNLSGHGLLPGSRARGGVSFVTLEPRYSLSGCQRSASASATTNGPPAWRGPAQVGQRAAGGRSVPSL